MSSRPPVLHVIALCACLLVHHLPLHACIWDSDTLASERARFPGIDMLITGSFAIHSREFHEWRLARRLKDIEAQPQDASLYDDLAVSQHKLGQHQAAIETMLKKDQLMPGLYETYSNLGTFYIYSGELDKALTTIDRALAINPNAHFGREKYQKWLVQWILEKQHFTETENDLTNIRYNGTWGFAHFVARKTTGGRSVSPAQKANLAPEQRAAAIRGVTGMMWFADYDNPHLQEALGDLLLGAPASDKAAHLASLCYLHASLKATEPAEKKRLTKKSEMSGRFIPRFDIKAVKKSLLAALDHGTRYRESVRQDELKWIAEGLDAQAKFQKKYLVPQEGK